MLEQENVSALKPHIFISSSYINPSMNPSFLEIYLLIKFSRLIQPYTPLQSIKFKPIPYFINFSIQSYHQFSIYLFLNSSQSLQVRANLTFFIEAHLFSSLFIVILRYFTEFFFHFQYLTHSYFSLLFLNYYFFFLLKLERSQFNQQMDIKVREALSNLAKQPPNPNLKKPDPLSIICAQRKKMRKTKVIQKQHMKREKKKGKNTKLQNQQSQNKIKVEKQEINQTKMDLQKYLPKQCDQFLDMERTEKKNDSDLYKIQNNSNLPELNEGKKPKLSPMKQEKAIMPQIDYQLLKTQLGIGIKDQPKVKIEQKPVLAKQECPNPLLPFPGRAFEQAPPRPAPKKICEYPPTDKVAGLYPWPPPQSDYRRWKNQMRESRKLE